MQSCNALEVDERPGLRQAHLHHLQQLRAAGEVQGLSVRRDERAEGFLECLRPG